VGYYLKFRDDIQKKIDNKNGTDADIKKISDIKNSLKYVTDSIKDQFLSLFDEL
jgi:hypothetical protein